MSINRTEFRGYFSDPTKKPEKTSSDKKITSQIQDGSSLLNKGAEASSVYGQSSVNLQKGSQNGALMFNLFKNMQKIVDNTPIKTTPEGSTISSAIIDEEDLAPIAEEKKDLGFLTGETLTFDPIYTPEDEIIFDPATLGIPYEEPETKQTGIYGQDINDPTNPLNQTDMLSPYYGTSIF